MIRAELLLSLTGIVAGGCSGATSRPTPVRARVRAPVVVIEPCLQKLARAEALVADGRLWQARRALNDCPPSRALQAKRTEIEHELGVARVPTAPLATAAVTATASQIEQAIRSGHCEQALSDAARLYERASPNPDAALLAGEAASCLGHAPEASRWYARTMLELDDAKTPASWRPLPVPRELRWLTSRSLRLDTWGGHVTLSRDDDQSWIARQDQRIEHGEPLCHDGGTVVELSPDDLHASRLPNHDQLWALPLGDHARALPTLGDRLLVLEPTARGLTVKRVDCATGRVLAKQNVKAHTLGHLVVSSRYTDWLIVSDERASIRVGYLLIDGKLGVRQLEKPLACEPLATWSSHEYLSSCGNSRQLFAVDFVSLQARPLTRLPEGFQLERATSVVPEEAGLIGNGLLLLREAGGAAELKVIAPPTSLSWEAAWSPDGQRLGGVGTDDNGRTLALVWNAREARTELDWPGYSAAVRHRNYRRRPGNPIRMASSLERRWLALATAEEVRSFDLSTGTTHAFVLAPEHAAPTILPARGGFALVTDGGTVLLWSPDSVPAVAPNVQLTAREGLTAAGGPWLIGQAPGARELVALDPRTGASVLIRGGALTGLSPDGAFVAYQADADTLGLGRLDASTSTMTEVWRRGAGAGQSSLVFSRDARSLFFSEGALGAPRVWQQLLLSSLEVRPEARDLSQAIDFDSTGRRWLTWTGELRGAGEAPRRLEHWASRGAEPRFVADDRLVAGADFDGAALWRARDGTFFGELQPLARGGVLFTPQPLPHEEQQGSSELTELLGKDASERLVCIVKQRFYRWEVCADRFEQPGLLVDRLAQLR